MNLSIFDFDGTLRSITGRWNPDTVAAAKRAYTRGYSVLLTGRPEFQRLDVIEALESRGIPFHRVTTVGPLFTGMRKRSEIERTVRAVGPEFVDVWDNDQALLDSYGKLLAAMGVPYRLHLVRGY
jgi:hypothetical protein